MSYTHFQIFNGISITAKSSEGVGGASLAVRAWFIVSNMSVIYRGVLWSLKRVGTSQIIVQR